MRTAQLKNGAVAYYDHRWNVVTIEFCPTVRIDVTLESLEKINQLVKKEKEQNEHRTN